MVTDMSTQVRRLVFAATRSAPTRPGPVILISGTRPTILDALPSARLPDVSLDGSGIESASLSVTSSRFTMSAHIDATILPSSVR